MTLMTRQIALSLCRLWQVPPTGSAPRASARTTVHDNEHVPVTLAWEQIAVTVDEGAGTANLRAMAVTTEDKRPEAGFSFEASIYTSNGTAIQTEDYTTLSETVVFQQSDFRQATVNGQRRYRAIKQVSVSIVDDTMDEPDEDFRVTLAYSGSSAPHLQGGPANVDVTITDNDHVPVTIEWTLSAIGASESYGPVTLEAEAVTIKDKAPESGFSFRVSVTTRDGSAQRDLDYRPLSTTAIFSQADFHREEVLGNMRYVALKEFVVTILEDIVDEEDEEEFTVTLAYLDPSQPHLQGGSSTFTMTIGDNDHVPVVLSWEQDEVTVGEPLNSGGTTEETLTVFATTTKDKMPESGFTFDITVNTADGSARQPGDYEQLSETLTFERTDFSSSTVNGQNRYRAEKTVTLGVAYDGTVEQDETFTVTAAYSGPSQPHLLPPNHVTATATITDDLSSTVDLEASASSIHSRVNRGGQYPLLLHCAERWPSILHQHRSDRDTGPGCQFP